MPSKATPIVDYLLYRRLTLHGGLAWSTHYISDQDFVPQTQSPQKPKTPSKDPRGIVKIKLSLIEQTCWPMQSQLTYLI